MHPNTTPTQGAINVATAIADISISGFSNQRFQQATNANSKLSASSKPKSSQQQPEQLTNPFDSSGAVSNLHPKFRLTFYICSIGFTSSILFDEQKRPYHLMLQRFDQLGGLKSLFDAFYWSLSLLGNNSSKTETISGEGDSGATSSNSAPIGGDNFQQLIMNQDRDKLHEGTLEFIEAWLTLIQKLVNTKNMLETRHSVNPNSSTTGGSSLSFYSNPTNLSNLQGDIKKVCSFDPIKFLFKVHKESFQALMCLWENKSFIIRENYSLSETVLNILCQILIGDSQLQKKLAEQQQAATAASANASAVATGASSLASRSNFSRDPRFAAMQSRFTEAAAQLQAVNTSSSTSSMNTDQPLLSGGANAAANVTATSSVPAARQLTPLDNELIMQMISMGFSAELAHEAVSRSPPDSLEQAVEYCFNHPNGATTDTPTATPATTSATTATTAATAATPTTTTVTNSNLEEILSNLNYTTSSTNEPATPVIEVSSTLPNIHQSLANIQQTIDSIEDSVNEATRMAAAAAAASRRDDKEPIVKMDENQSSSTSASADDSDQIHQLDKVILDKFANNMLPGLTKILDNVPDTVYRVCDLIVVVVKKYGDQWRDNSLLYILNETCDLIKQVCDIYANKSSAKLSGN
jgi:hypothetical protein